ncbi:MAG: DNA repair protein RadA, partial [Snodgrassella sp.]|nr:DNA repair protein RadA [Snodgrassella sp.]
MVKQKTQFQCRNCGGNSPKWQGRCPHCGEWNTLEETAVLPAVASNSRFQSWAAGQTQVQLLAEVSAVEVQRTATGMGELDRV